jgi:hypothetical protein
LIEGILGLARDAPQIPIWHITEGDAINYLTPKEEADREKRKTTRPSAIEFKLIEGEVHVIQACIARKSYHLTNRRFYKNEGSCLREMGRKPLGRKLSFGVTRFLLLVAFLRHELSINDC